MDNLVKPNCRNECKQARCECQSKNGFVRAHDGACIPVTECSTYRGIYYSQSGQIVTNFGGVVQTSNPAKMDPRASLGAASATLPPALGSRMTGFESNFNRILFLKI